MADLPIVKHSERQHILVTGTTGAGKTNLLHQLMPQIKKRGDKAIVVDVTGSLTTSYFGPEKDKILNPFDKRSVNWLPWIDCKEDYEYDMLAKAIIGESSHHESFWEDSAQKILAEALKIFADNRSLSQMLQVLITSSLERYAHFFQDTAVAPLTAKDGDRTVASIRMSMNNKIKSLSHLQETSNPFSLKQFVLSDSQEWLYITATPNQRETLKPLIASWLEVIFNALMARPLDHQEQNIWIIMDELPAFGKIPSLKTALAESRKYGGCLVAGIQNIYQLMHIYGRSTALDLLDQFSTRYLFRVGDQETAQIASKVLGEKELQQAQESLSYGANTIRDGVNVQTMEKRMALVSPTEVMSLPDLSCYVKLAGSWPVTRIAMQYKKPTIKQEFFVKRNETHL